MLVRASCPAGTPFDVFAAEPRSPCYLDWVLVYTQLGCCPHERPRISSFTRNPGRSRRQEGLLDIGDVEHSSAVWFIRTSLPWFFCAETRDRLGSYPGRRRHNRRVWLGINNLNIWPRDIASAAHLSQEPVECSYKCDVETVPDTRSETNNGRDSGLI